MTNCHHDVLVSSPLGWDWSQDHWDSSGTRGHRDVKLHAAAEWTRQSRICRPCQRASGWTYTCPGLHGSCVHGPSASLQTCSINNTHSTVTQDHSLSKVHPKPHGPPITWQWSMSHQSSAVQDDGYSTRTHQRADVQPPATDQWEETNLHDDEKRHFNCDVAQTENSTKPVDATKNRITIS